MAKQVMRKFYVAVNHFLRGGKWDSDLEEAFGLLISASERSQNCDVEILLAVSKDDLAFFSKKFQKHPNITISTLKHPDQKPQLADILSCIDKIERVDAGTDYCVYLNSDICVPDFFFDFVDLNLNLVPNGGGLIINRKDVISGAIHDMKPSDDLRLLVHFGLDCFIFPRSGYEKFSFGSVSIGLPPIGMLFTVNMCSTLPSVKLIHNPMVTWHYGDGQQSDWHREEFRPQIKKNRLAAFDALDVLLKSLKEKGGGGLEGIGVSSRLILKYKKNRRNRNKQKSSGVGL
ncbi:MAG: hypothetical protein AAF429_15075 [Pseudomonadota bacterium]